MFSRFRLIAFIGVVFISGILHSISPARTGLTYYFSNGVMAALEEALHRPVTGVAVPRETWVDSQA